MSIRGPAVPSAAGEVRRSERVPAHYDIWGHPSIIYWWPVWIYGYICAIVTVIAGKKVELGGNTFLIYEGSWLGLSFLGLVLFVIMFTAWKVQAYLAFVLLLVMAMVSQYLVYAKLWDKIFSNIVLPVVYMNLAFYLIFSTVILVVWSVAIFLLDRATFWRFEHNKAEYKNSFNPNLNQAYGGVNMVVVARPPGDFLRRALGLFMTGDIAIKPSDMAPEVLVLNVWNAERHAKMITKVLATQVVRTTK